ncbi:hypothetical protein [Sinomonas flava]|uniref:hypothetical protein n=1 Tax=Sinomonas flava TaxID=496857 RepID=UPI0039A4CEBD
MAKFLILYRSPRTAREQMANTDSAAAAAGMDAWNAWGERAAAALVDMGSPVQSVAGPGGGDPIGGFSIMQGGSLGEVQGLLEGHPHTESGGTIEVLEFLPMPGVESTEG